MAMLVASWSCPKGPTQNQRFQEDRDYLVSFGITTQEELVLDHPRTIDPGEISLGSNTVVEIL